MRGPIAIVVIQAVATIACAALFVASRSPLTLVCAIGNAGFLYVSVLSVLDIRTIRRRLAELQGRVAHAERVAS